MKVGLLLAALVGSFGGARAVPHAHHVSDAKAHQEEKPRRGINFTRAESRLLETSLSLRLHWGFDLSEAQHASNVLEDKFVLNELDGSHNSTRRYHYGAANPLAVADSAGARWLLNDALGSVSDEVLLGGALFNQRQYNAWGEYRNSSAPTTSEAKVGYEGHQFDPETNLTYARARYLDNSLGITLSRDSFEGSFNDAPSLHRYNWARVGPLRYDDFSGRCWAFSGTDGLDCGVVAPARIAMAVVELRNEEAGARSNVSGGMMVNETRVQSTTSAAGASGDVATRIRVHTADPTAPPGSNSATGNTVSITQGGGTRRYLPDQGWVQTSTATPEEMNSSHIPIQRESPPNQGESQ